MPNKEKLRQHGRQKSAKNEKTSVSESFSTSSPDPKRGTTRTPLRPVESIIEDEEDTVAANPPPPSRPRQLSAATAAGYRASFIRMRSASTSTSDPSAKSTSAPRDPTRSDSDSSPPPTSEATQKRKSPPPELDMGATKMSTGRLARNRVSLDVEDVMGDSDEELLGSTGRKPSQDKRKGLSPSTRELIDFLAEGPPEPMMLSPNGNGLTQRKSGRLQKMISRITLASSNESTKASRRMTGSHEPSASRNPSATNLSPLANRPIPPRYHTPGPPSATSSDQEAASMRLRSQSAPRMPASHENRTAVAKEQVPVPPIPSIVSGSDFCHSPGTLSKKLSESTLNKQVEPNTRSTRVESPSTHPRHGESLPLASPTVSSAVSSPRPSVEPSSPPAESAPVVYVPARVSSKGVSTRSLLSESPPPPPVVPTPVADHARDMRRMLARATSAEECRLLVDIFLTRSKLITDAAELHALVAFSPEPSTREMNVTIENAVVGLFLGDGDEITKQPDAETGTVTLLVNGHAESNDI